MSISLNFELNDRDLEHFQDGDGRVAQGGRGQECRAEIIDCAGELLVDAQKVRIPDFIVERLLRLDAMIAMVARRGLGPAGGGPRSACCRRWCISPIRNDVIPDSVPVLGYFDDAIVIELCVRELKHEIDAYDDFCDYRQHEADRRGVDAGQRRPRRLARSPSRRTAGPHAPAPRARIGQRLRQQQPATAAPRLCAGAATTARLAPGHVASADPPTDAAVRPARWRHPSMR